ncbi:1,4-dihydroxy-2-naphthoate polyprenyltransferase, partial [Cronobacter muytjensii]
ARRYHVGLLAGALGCLAAFNLLWLQSPWGWAFLLATPLLARQARVVLRDTDPAAMRPMLERTVKAALLVNLLFIVGLVLSQRLG